MGAVDVVKRFVGDAITLERDLSPEEQRGDVLDVVLDPDVVFQVAPSIPHGGAWVGRQGLAALFATFREHWENLEGANGEYFDLGDGRVLYIVEPTIQSHRTGMVLKHRMVEVFTVRDGKIVEMVPYYWDSTLLIEAAGGSVDTPWRPAPVPPSATNSQPVE